MRTLLLLAVAALALLALPATAEAHFVVCPSPAANPVGFATCSAACWNPQHLLFDALNGFETGCAWQGGP